MKLLFVLNPRSGKGKIKSNLSSIVDTMVKAGYEVTIYTTQAQGDATRKVKEEAKNYDHIVCSGGDGTLDEVVTGIVESGVDITLGYIPAGSTNDFASSLGIPKDMVKAAEVAVNGKPFACDIGEFNGKTFVYVSAFGPLAEVSYKTPQKLKNTIGYAAYLLEGAKRILELKSTPMIIKHDGEVVKGKFFMGLITNSISVGGIKGITGKNIELDDGLFEVTFLKTPKNPAQLKQLAECMLNRDKKSDLVYSVKTKELKVVSKTPISWTRDGEDGGEHRSVVIKNLHKKIRIMH